MLNTITIKNVVLIEKLTIEFKNGLCALTGETGAGKSILLDSLGLALGGRSEARLVRKGSEKAVIIASFDVEADHPSQQILNKADVECVGGEIILRRSVGADGRSKAYINDQPVSVTLLKQVGETLVEIHGQHDTRGLLDPSNHRTMLDDYVGVDGALPKLWQVWSVQREELAQLREQAVNARAEEEYLRQSLEDLDALSAEPGEEEKLSNLRESLMHRERLLEALNAAYHALNAEEDPVRKAWASLDRVADKLGAEGGEAIQALERASTEMQEAMTCIQSISSDLEHSEYNLETVDDRLHELRNQARKHGCEPEDLAAKRDDLATKLNIIEYADDVLDEKARSVEKARAAYIKQAEALSTQRMKASKILDSMVQKELPPLKMERAKFVTKLDKLPEEDWNAYGMDRVRFLVATNPGAEPGPLGKIASGGEMSRFMLALKVVMAEEQSGQSLIFDEVDAGIGGATADAVGERLARLAGNNQIMVVTHSPQVAARASHHWIVKKSGNQDVTTNVIPLPANEDRREEIARMLAGASVTEEARAAAEKLLETGS